MQNKNDEIYKFLEKNGPSLSSKIVSHMAKTEREKETIRQRLCRSSFEKLKGIFPNREVFFYLKEQFNTDEYYGHLLKELEEKNTAYYVALCGIKARGVVKKKEFPVISGAPDKMKKQIYNSTIIKNLLGMGLIKETRLGEDSYYVSSKDFSKDFESGDKIDLYETRDLYEERLLEAVEDWARKLYFGSYNTFSLRGRDEAEKRMTGQFMWDIVSPSYLWPLKAKGVNKTKPGFFVADIFYKDLEIEDIKYIQKKLKLLQHQLPETKIFPFLIAKRFSEKAFSELKGLGIVPATIENLFGPSVQEFLEAIDELTKNPKEENLNKILENYKSLLGNLGNFRGLLFELITYTLVQEKGAEVEHSVKIELKNLDKKYEIDVLKKTKEEYCAIECKGFYEGKLLNKETAEKYIGQLDHCYEFLEKKAFSENKRKKISFELWTTGSFHQHAIDALEKKKKEATKYTLSWKDREAILAKAKEQGCLKKTRERLKNYFKQRFEEI